MLNSSSIVDRLLGYVEQKETAQEKDVYRVQPEVYLDPGRFSRERSAILERAPTLACLSAELDQPGDFVARDEARIPYFVCRDPEGNVRAFLNACRHRGAKLVSGRGTGRKAIPCPYHAWTYNLRGDLLSVYQEATFGCVEEGQHGLIPLACEERAGMVFVSLSGAPLDLDAHLGSLDDELAAWRLTELVPATQSVEVPCHANWKLAMETFAEFYHLFPIHRESIPNVIGNIMTYDRFGRGEDLRHSRMCAPLKSISKLKTCPASTWASQITEHVHFVYFVYPNVSIYVAGDAVGISQIFPGETVDRSRVRVSAYHRPGVDASSKADQLVRFISGVVRDEDFPQTEGIQRAIASGHLPSTVFGRNELALHHIHETWSRDLLQHG